MSKLYPLCRKFLFKLDPERAHQLVCKSLNYIPHNLFRATPECAVKLMGLHFKNPIGLAAGFDASGVYLPGLSKLGFGFIEIGGVTPRAQVGNPKPRIFRLITDKALINRVGFPNPGLDVVVKNLEKRQYAGILGVNIAKNKDTPNERAIDDYLLSVNKLYPLVDYITVNLSSPNTPQLRALQFGKNLENLLSELKEAQDKLQTQHQKYVPLVVKVAPDLTSDEVLEMANTFLKYQIDGVVATNSTLSRDSLIETTIAQETGGLCGAPLHSKSIAIISALKAVLKNQIPIIGLGGIIDANSAKATMHAGAQLIQLYTGLIYQGPGLVHEIARELAIASR